MGREEISTTIKCSHCSKWHWGWLSPFPSWQVIWMKVRPDAPDCDSLCYPVSVPLEATWSSWHWDCILFIYSEKDIPKIGLIFKASCHRMVIWYQIALCRVISLGRLMFFKVPRNSKYTFSHRNTSFLEGLVSDLCCLPFKIEASQRASYFKRKCIL